MTKLSPFPLSDGAKNAPPQGERGISKSSLKPNNTAQTLHLIGYASGIAGANPHVGDGPQVMRQSSYLINQNLPIHWETMIEVTPNMAAHPVADIVGQMCTHLASTVSALVREHQPFCVIGGDNTCSIGTWSGVYDALHEQGDIGLIWVDAHMDSHTPETTESGHIHGMPLACLLGHGYPTLTAVLHAMPKLKPENICLIGVRSFESGEAALLQRLNVRVYLMEEVQRRGFAAVLSEAVQQVTQKTIGYGLMIDIDSIDPQEAPAVDVPVLNGIHVTELLLGLWTLTADPRLIATEITEFDPVNDKARITEKLIATCLTILSRSLDNR